MFAFAHHTPMYTEPTHEFWACELQGNALTLVRVTFKDSDIESMEAVHHGCLYSMCLPGNAGLVLCYTDRTSRSVIVDWEWAQWMVAEWKKRCAARDAPPGAPAVEYTTV